MGFQPCYCPAECLDWRNEGIWGALHDWCEEDFENRARGYRRGIVVLNGFFGLLLSCRRL